MKKRFSFVAAVVCAAGMLWSCGSDNKGQDELPIHPLVGTYTLEEYTVNADEKNVPVTSPMYSVWESTDQAFTGNMSNFFKVAGAAMLPQLINAIELKADGNLCASYAVSPVVKGQDKLMAWGMGSIMGSPFPKIDEVKALHADLGKFEMSKSGLASWSEQNGKFVVKLDLAGIMTEKMGPDGATMAETVLSFMTMEPAALKNMLAAILGDDIKKVSDSSIKTVQNWVLEGIPMVAKEVEKGKLTLYLPKQALDPFMTTRPSGTTDEYGDEIMENDINIIWNCLVKMNMIPAEAAMAGVMVQMLGQYWNGPKNTTSDFALGLNLVRK